MVKKYDFPVQPLYPGCYVEHKIIKKIVNFLQILLITFSLITATETSYKETIGLTPDSEIEEATFVHLDFSKYPSLPPKTIPATKTIFVSTNGNDKTGNGLKNSPYRTISKALKKANSGYTIVISKGNYPEVYEKGDYRGLVINKNNITIMAVPGETVEMIPANKKVTYGILVEGNDFSIRGINIKGFSTIGILFNDSKLKNMVITDLIITKSSEGIATWGGTVNNLLAFNIKIKKANQIGFHCGEGYGYNWRLERCLIDMDATGSGSGADAFAIENGENILLVNCEVTGASADGIDTKAKRVVVYGCHVHHVARNGIKLWHGGDVINCLVHHTGADASIVVEEGPKTRLLNTIIAYHNFGAGSSYNMTFGYDSQASMKVELINSIILNTAGGAYMNPKCDVTISHSVFYGIENGEILQHGSNTIKISQGTSGLLSYGPGNLVKNPGLDSNFHANSKSPTINTGVKLTTDFPIKDMNGKKRVKRNTPDLGPFEDY